MTARAPARAPGQKRSVILSANDDDTGARLLLEMAFEAKTLVAGDQHSLVDRTVRLVTSRAAFTQRLMLIDKGPELHCVTLAAGLVFRKQRGPAGLHHRALVGVVTVSATHLALEHGMMVRQAELPALVEVALKTGLRRFARVDDGVTGAARLIVKAPRTVAGFAARVLGVVSRRFQSGVCGGLEIARNRLVTLRTSLRADEFRAGDIWRRQDGPIDRGAGNRHSRCRHDSGNRKYSPARGGSLPGIAVLLGRAMHGVFHRDSVGFRKPLRLPGTFILGEHISRRKETLNPRRLFVNDPKGFSRCLLIEI